MPQSETALKKNVAVIGAGWAGLAAAHTLQQQGMQAHLFEQSHTLGGRARKVHSRKLDKVIDNGQHLLIGAYSETLQIMQELGLEEKQCFLRMPLAIATPQQDFRLRVKPGLPSPLHFLYAIGCAKGLTLPDKHKLVQALLKLKLRKWRVTSGQTVAQWLKQEKQSVWLVRFFWEPLCIATLNTATPEACMQLFANVLQHSTDAGKQASDFLIPRSNLSALWPEKLNPQIPVYYGKSIQQVQRTATAYQIDGQDFDAVILATPPAQCARIIGNFPDSKNYSDLLEALGQFRFNPIITITLELENNWDLPLPVYLLKTEDPARDPGQWLFMRSSFVMDSSRPEVTVVISQASHWLEKTKEELIGLLLGQLQRQAPAHAPLPPIKGWDLITEKKATFSAEPGLQRLPNRSCLPALYLAGDWTDTGFPGVLEGAVRSGRQAARLLVQDLI
ncbi:MAG: NAD(P)-binding protein [Alcaligenaceae bacterium]|nr:NAD(P)-binding protein [Alcaligenaceae bacterium]